MKIISAEEFLKLPMNTLYSKYTPCVFGALQIKGDTLSGAFDYASQQIVDAIDCTGSDDFFDKLTDAEENGTSLKMDFDCCGRDGMFDRQQLYAVWEQSDVVLLMERLKLCLDNQ